MKHLDSGTTFRHSVMIFLNFAASNISSFFLNSSKSVPVSTKDQIKSKLRYMLYHLKLLFSFFSVVHRAVSIPSLWGRNFGYLRRQNILQGQSVRQVQFT
eukprot:TRINITY_DN12901_c0_g1_i4.p1 TRINITY_DN12901_c0_g1~~TRINITY_DN12901_c0_g1_i4.p1  ORF type:complete len:100 (+),score=5.45 TRINITY_DN12901_c0_g1_i4:203-502(+)